jgi:metalloendopeptidase OMA1, mitochondrial
MADVARRQHLEEYRGKILPPNHPITRHIRDVVNRILQANDLGILKTPSPAKVLRQAHDDTWDADGAYGGRTQSLNPEAGGNQWELLVVDDDSIVNAAASFGWCLLHL